MSANAEHLARRVLERREEQEWTQLDVYMAGGPSNTTLTEIENARIDRLSRSTAKKLDKGLRWEEGSAREAWNGGEPTPLLRQDMSSKTSAALRQQIAASDLEPAVRDELLRVLDQRGAAG